MNLIFIADISIVDEHIQVSRPSPQKQSVFQRLEPSVEDVEIVNEPRQSVFDGRLQPREDLDQDWMRGMYVLIRNLGSNQIFLHNIYRLVLTYFVLIQMHWIPQNLGNLYLLSLRASVGQNVGRHEKIVSTFSTL